MRPFSPTQCVVPVVNGVIDLSSAVLVFPPVKGYGDINVRVFAAGNADVVIAVRCAASSASSLPSCDVFLQHIFCQRGDSVETYALTVHAAVSTAAGIRQLHRR